ncbi:hypothetical protein, partial [Micromonospora chalcea]|uniref:hypothetical protein n=1 Tax=Micromonospora chalcea TaxID=1874 RepID=UPI0035B658DB
METLRALAARLDEAGATLATLARTVTATDPPHPAFGAHAAGRPGEVGRAAAGQLDRRGLARRRRRQRRPDPHAGHSHRR